MRGPISNLLLILSFCVNQGILALFPSIANMPTSMLFFVVLTNCLYKLSDSYSPDLKYRISHFVTEISIKGITNTEQPGCSFEFVIRKVPDPDL